MARSLNKVRFMHNTKGAKQEANRKVRRVRKKMRIPDGKQYRKVYDPWDICDYHFLVTEVDEWTRRKHASRIRNADKKHVRNEYRRARRIKRKGDTV